MYINLFVQIKKKNNGWFFTAATFIRISAYPFD